MKKAFSWLLLVLIITCGLGCATAADIRAKAPYHTLLSGKQAKKIVDCVLHRAPAEVTCAAVPYYHFSLSEEPPGTFHILAEIPGQPSGEAVFIPAENGGTVVELRARWNFWGKESFWECIERCAKSP
jgi:hypothetical protein